MRSLGLLSVAHAINHAQAVVLPLIFLKIVDEFGVGIETIAFLAAIGAFLAGMVQLSYAGLTRVVSRRRLLGFGGILFGGGFALTASRDELRDVRHPEHRVADRRVAAAPGRQRPAGGAVPAREARVRHLAPTSPAATSGPSSSRSSASRSSRRSAGAGAAVAFGLPAIAVGILILLFVRERGTDRAAAVASGTVRSAFGQDPARPATCSGCT